MRYSTTEIRDLKKRVYKPVQKKRRPVKISGIFKSIFVIFVLIFLIIHLSPVFRVSRIEIHTDNGISANYLSAGFNLSEYIGLNALYLPSDAIAQSLYSIPKIDNVKISKWEPSVLKIYIETTKPVAAIARPWGFYRINSDGRFVDIVPPYADVGLMVKMRDDSFLFDETGSARRFPWAESLSGKNLSEHELMYSLGYRGLMDLSELVEIEGGIPEVQFIGYDEDYGLVMKCKNRPLVLLGYGNDLPLHFSKARRILLDPEFPYAENEDKYIDIRFKSFSSAKKLDNLPDLFEN